jgi:hypothetical protein
MFARFRQTSRRLQVSLIETKRANGKVCHEHIASMGSVAATMEVWDRIEFWSAFWPRLGKLDNRLSAEQQHKIVGEIQARIPMATPAEQQALQLRNAEDDARLYEILRDHFSTIREGQESLATKAQEAAQAATAGAEDAASKEAGAKARVESLKAGNPVLTGFGKPRSLIDALRAAGVSQESIDSGMDQHRLVAIVGEERFDKFLGQVIAGSLKTSDRYRRKRVKAALRRLQEKGLA